MHTFLPLSGPAFSNTVLDIDSAVVSCDVPSLLAASTEEANTELLHLPFSNFIFVLIIIIHTNNIQV